MGENEEWHSTTVLVQCQSHELTHEKDFEDHRRTPEFNALHAYGWLDSDPMEEEQKCGRGKHYESPTSNVVLQEITVDEIESQQTSNRNRNA
jgi:hypothetical protein